MRNHEDRRAIQTVLYDVLVALTKLVTPILPHTADEVCAIHSRCNRRKCTIN
ncbi:class I tRNA ligase family protein [Bacillus paranthracis]